MLPVRLRGVWHGLQDSLWLLPSLAVVLAVTLARVLVLASGEVPAWVPAIVAYTGSADGARAILAELAGATFTVMGLVFSLTVVALQMAATQFTPRILRTFLKDRSVQVVLSGMIGSGVFHVAVLRYVRTPVAGDPFVPDVAVSASLLLALGAVGLLVFFLHRLTRQLRVDVVMVDIRRELLAKLADISPPRDALPDQPPIEVPSAASPIRARTTGFLQTVDLGRLARLAERHDLVVRLRPNPGEWVAKGTTVAWVWGDGGAAVDVDEDLAVAIHQGFHLGSERTEADDTGFAVRQIVDIAVRALSPGVNDPTTAVQAIEQLGAILVVLADRPLGAAEGRDEQGVRRSVQPSPTFGEFLDVAIAQPRRFARSQPVVLIELLRLLIDVAERVADSADRAEAVRGQARRTHALADLVDPADMAEVTVWAEAVEATLASGVRPAELPA